MFPCVNPQICGVQNHRAGTVCQGTRSDGSHGRSSFIPPMEGAQESDAYTSGHTRIEISDDSVATQSFSGDRVDVIVMNDSMNDDPESKMVFLFETDRLMENGYRSAILYSDGMEELGNVVRQTSDGELYIEGTHGSDSDDKSPVKFISIKGTETTGAYEDEGETDIPPMVRSIKKINESPEALAFLKQNASVYDPSDGKFQTLNDAKEQD